MQHLYKKVVEQLLKIIAWPEVYEPANELEMKWTEDAAAAGLKQPQAPDFPYENGDGGKKIVVSHECYNKNS